MKILFEHADHFLFTEKKQPSKKYINCLIARICIEAGDEAKMGVIVEEIKKIYLHLKPISLVLFPFSHLSSEIQDYLTASNFYDDLAQKLTNKNINVVTLPFGINKGYEIIIKEHKLNNIFRNF